MGKSIAFDTARRGVTVNTVVPGCVETDITRSSGAEVVARMEETWSKIPAEAVASLVGFLVSPEADHVPGRTSMCGWEGPRRCSSRLRRTPRLRNEPNDIRIGATHDPTGEEKWPPSSWMPCGGGLEPARSA
jgi:hypothetical protein